MCVIGFNPFFGNIRNCSKKSFIYIHWQGKVHSGRENMISKGILCRCKFIIYLIKEIHLKESILVERNLAVIDCYAKKFTFRKEKGNYFKGFRMSYEHIVCFLLS
jgi:hypothetical protein